MFVDLGKTFAEFDVLRREIDSVFNHHGRHFRAEQRYPLINIYENTEQIEIVAEVPGVVMEDLEITYAEGVIKLAGERKLHSEFDGSSQVTLRQERSGGKFEKQYRIPTKIDGDAISASLKDGVLSVVLPKAEEAKPKKIEIQA